MAFSFLWGSEHRLKGGLKKGLNGGPKGGLQGGLKGGLEAGLQGMNLIFFVFNHPQSVFVWLSPACGVVSTFLFMSLRRLQGGFEEKLKGGFKGGFRVA